MPTTTSTRKNQSKKPKAYPLKIINEVSQIEHRQAMLLQNMKKFLQRSPDNNMSLQMFKNSYRNMEREKIMLLRRL
jgi:hypothetical protein